MKHRLEIEILAQPDESTCGPTCLHAVYRYHGLNLPLERLIAEVPQLPTGGTLAVNLACHALERGFRARIYSYNLQVFDPTWQGLGPEGLSARLRAQRKAKRTRRLRAATDAYLRYLGLGGELRFEDLSPRLLRRYLRRELPVITGLSCTYLYREARELPGTTIPDDVRGEPTGHFVVLCGTDPGSGRVRIADPWEPHPVAEEQVYDVSLDRATCAILLGVVTHDANLLVVAPRELSTWPS